MSEAVDSNTTSAIEISLLCLFLFMILVLSAAGSSDENNPPSELVVVEIGQCTDTVCASKACDAKNKCFRVTTLTPAVIGSTLTPDGKRYKVSNDTEITYE